MELNKITEIIIGSCYEVYNTLGFGFLEKVYENALAYELRSKQMKETDPVHKAQVLNYLKATNLKLGLLVNFSPKTVEVKRIVN